MKSFSVLFSILLFSGASLAQSNSARILGVWLNTNRDTKIEVSEVSGKYTGKIVWLAEPNTHDGFPKTDRNNPDPKLRGREILGMPILSDLRYADGKWIDGVIYSPVKGKTVDCSVQLSEDGHELHIRASRGFFSTTVVWTRAGKE